MEVLHFDPHRSRRVPGREAAGQAAAVVELVGQHHRRHALEARCVVDRWSHRTRLEQDIAARRVVDTAERGADRGRMHDAKLQAHIEASPIILRVRGIRRPDQHGACGGHESAPRQVAGTVSSAHGALA